jgi:hypothetical protein
MWVVSSAFIILFLSKLDSIVHHDLYEYGLSFNFNWATPFWSYERLIYVCLAAPLVFSGVALVWDFWKSGKNDIAVVKYTGTKSINGRAMQLKENAMVISCPKCRKVFGKPLTMLDFSGGRTRLVNVCPYCNHILGSANEKTETDVEVVDLDEKEERVTR